MFNTLNMRSGGDDLKAAAVIRDCAMRLFADRGVSAVTVRDVATAAGVSPGLVIHHYKSKDGLKAAADERALTLLRELFESASGPPADGVGGDDLSASLTAMFVEVIGRNPVLPAYLRRLLVDGGPPAEELFRSLYEVTRVALDRMQDAGLIRPAADPDARAAFLLSNDLAAMVLRDQIAAVLGIDPLSPEGLRRYGETLMAVYSEGVFVGQPPGRDPTTGKSIEMEKR